MVRPASSQEIQYRVRGGQALADPRLTSKISRTVRHRVT